MPVEPPDTPLPPTLRIETALFCYGGIQPQTHICIERDTCEALSRPEDNSYSLTRAAWWNDALIDRCRGMAAEQFLTTGCDVLVMIDHDIAWQPGDIVHIAKKAWEKQAIVGGCVAKRQRGTGIASVPAVNGTYALGSDALVPAPYVGSAFTAIPRAIVEAVARGCVATSQGFRPMFMPMIAPTRDPEKPDEFDYLSEDWAFCRRATDLGFRCFLSMRPITEHHGNYAYTIMDAQEPPKKTPPKFSLIHATRGRPKMAIAAHKAWMERQTGLHEIEYIVSMDDDDPDPPPGSPPPGMVAVVGSSRGNVDAYNRGAFASTGDILIQVHDDVMPPVGWDEALIKALGGDWDREAVVRVSDGLPPEVNGARPLLPVLIGTSKWFRACGYMYGPCYVSVFCDNDAAELAEHHGCAIVDARDLVFQHNYQGHDRDETQRRSYAKVNWEQGVECLIRRRAAGFPKNPAWWGDAKAGMEGCLG